MSMRYSDAQRATALAALDANGGDRTHTARQLGIPESTLRSWDSGRRRDIPAIAELRAQKKADLATELETVAYQLAAAMPGKIEGASLQQLATSLGIAIDKVQLLKGQPTSITAAMGLSERERAERVVTLLETARQRRLAAG